jgi:hypothetical protein
MSCSSSTRPRSIALLPLVARGLPGGDAGTFTLLLASMGAGAIVAACCCRGCASAGRATAWWHAAPGCRRWHGHRGLGTQYPGWPALAMVASGMAWITTANALSVSAQFGLPDWVRARGMSMYQMAIMGASAAGAAMWGQVATWTTTDPRQLVAAAAPALADAAGQPLDGRQPDRGGPDARAHVQGPPQPQQPPGAGRAC